MQYLATVGSCSVDLHAQNRPPNNTLHIEASLESEVQLRYEYEHTGKPRGRKQAKSKASATHDSTQLPKRRFVHTSLRPLLSISPAQSQYKQCNLKVTAYAYLIPGPHKSKALKTPRKYPAAYTPSLRRTYSYLHRCVYRVASRHETIQTPESVFTFHSYSLSPLT